MENSVKNLHFLTLTCFFFFFLDLYVCMRTLAYSCMRKLFAPHAAGPVICLKSAVETAGLGFQPMPLVCVWVGTATGVTVVLHAKPLVVVVVVVAAVVLSLMQQLRGSTCAEICGIILSVFNSS